MNKQLTQEDTQLANKGKSVQPLQPLGENVNKTQMRALPRMAQVKISDNTKH